MANELIESLRKASAEGAEQAAAEAKLKEKEAETQRAEEAAVKDRKRKELIAEQVALAINEIVTDAKDAATQGKTTISKDWGKVWEARKQPAELIEELGVAVDIRDQVAEHFTALEFKVRYVDEVISKDVEPRPEDEGYWPATTQCIIGLEIAWLNPDDRPVTN